MLNLQTKIELYLQQAVQGKLLAPAVCYKCLKSEKADIAFESLIKAIDQRNDSSRELQSIKQLARAFLILTPFHENEEFNALYECAIKIVYLAQSRLLKYEPQKKGVVTKLPEFICETLLQNNLRTRSLKSVLQIVQDRQDGNPGRLRQLTSALMTLQSFHYSQDSKTLLACAEKIVQAT